MDFPRLKCVYGVLKRVINNYGKSRPDMGGYCQEKFNKSEFEFLETVCNFNKKNRTRYYDIIYSQNDVEIIILKNSKQTANFLQKL